MGVQVKAVVNPFTLNVWPLVLSRKYMYCVEGDTLTVPVFVPNPHVLSVPVAPVRTALFPLAVAPVAPLVPTP